MPDTLPAPSAPRLRTSLGDVPLQEYRLALGGRTWSVLHSEAMLTMEDEQRYLSLAERLPFGVVLWPAAIALAHDLAARGDALRGASVLELGAGTGLPGIVAASLGARVVQTDRVELALDVCRRNAARNGVAGIAHRLADWRAWDDAARYDWIVGADVLYAEGVHDDLRRIFATNLAPGGRLLLADPFRKTSFPLLEALAADGWAVTVAKWTIDAAPPRGSAGARADAPEPRSVGVFTCVR